MSREDIKNKWRQVYSYIIPSIVTAGYIYYLSAIYLQEKDTPLMQDSLKFDSMLEALVTFMSIILSVFGFLIPLFLDRKGESKAIAYFLKHADMKLFAAKLKNIVAIGLIDTFLTCVLFIRDIFSVSLTNGLVCIWLWFLIFFMCNSYRFISIMVNLLVVEKEEFVQKAANDVDAEEKKRLDNAIRKI